MDELIDFSDARVVVRSYGGSSRKIAVKHGNKVYMLKFSQHHAQHTDTPTNCVNRVFSEYICSHITETIGLPVHRTVLGVCDKKTRAVEPGKVVVVGCEDFRLPGDTNAEFSEFLRAEFRKDEIKPVVRLDQIYTVLNDKSYFTDELREKSINRYWDTFVVDALVGNSDRHPGNWGYIYNHERLWVAPIYSFGSCLLPQLSDEGIDEIINDEYQMLRRCYVFPSPVLCITEEKTGKVGYYDMLSSGYDRHCSEALLRIAPRINAGKIEEVIDNTPLITPKRKEFYKKYVLLRKRVIIDRAYGFIRQGTCDTEAKRRIEGHVQFSEGDLQEMIDNRKLDLL